MFGKIVLLALLSVVLIFGNVESNSLRPAKPEGRQILDSVPENEKDDFLVYHFAKGHLLKNPTAIKSYPHVIDDIPVPKDLQEKFVKMETPDRFTLNLLDWVKEDYGVTTDGIYELGQGHCIQLSNGAIYCPPDFNEACCPF